MSNRTGRPGGTDFEYYKAVGRTSELTTRQKLVAMLIRNHWSPGGRFNPSNATLAKMAGCSPRQVQRELAVLHRLGWLDRELIPGRTTVWTPMIPDGYLRVRDGTTTRRIISKAHHGR